MSGASNPATEAPAPSTVSRTVAPAVLQQLAPSVRYLDPAQSDVVMESGTKSPTVSRLPPPPPLPCARAGLVSTVASLLFYNAYRGAYQALCTL